MYPNAHEPPPGSEELATDLAESGGRLSRVAGDLRVRLNHRLEDLPDHLAFVGIGLLDDLFASLEQPSVRVQEKQLFLDPKGERRRRPEVLVR